MYTDLDQLEEEALRRVMAGRFEDWLRRVKDGDEIRDKIKLLGGTKKVKDLFIGLKVPREERSFVPFVVNNDTVVSIYGYRINVDYKVDDDTKRILEISID